MSHVSHQASHAIGFLVVEFILQFITYQMSNSRTRAFDKGVNKPTLKIVQVSILIIKIFRLGILYEVSLLLTYHFQASTQVSMIPLYIYINSLLCVIFQPINGSRPLKAKCIVSYTFGLFFCFVYIANERTQRVYLFCAISSQLFLYYCTLLCRAHSLF